MRLFIAIFPPSEVREQLLIAARRLPLEGKIRWTRASNVHLTLKFLGDIEEECLDGIRAVLGTVAGRHAPFRVEPADLGAFPSTKKARVLWAGVDRGSAALVDLAEDIERGLEPLGFVREKRSYKPHVTLGRVRRRPVKMPSGVATRAQDFLARRIELVESVLGPEGAEYSVRENYPLSGPPQAGLK